MFEVKYLGNGWVKKDWLTLDTSIDFAFRPRSSLLKTQNRSRVAWAAMYRVDWRISGDNGEVNGMLNSHALSKAGKKPSMGMASSH